MKQAKPRSQTSVFDLSKYLISYEDDCWELHEEVTDGSYTVLSLNFNKFPRGWKMAGKEHMARTILGWTSRPSQVPQTLRERFYCLVSFAMWCCEQGATSPSRVDAELIKYWGRAVAGYSMDGHPVQSRTMSFRTNNIVEFLREQPSCSSSVRAASSALAQEARRRRSMEVDDSATAPLPEDLALSILQDAITVVLGDAPKVIQLLSSCVTELATRHKRRGRRHWHSQWKGVRPIFESRALSGSGIGEKLSEETLYSVVNGAAIVVIALLSVMRTSELQRLKVGCVERDGKDDLANWIVRGTLSKSGRAHSWVIVPEVKAAVDVIEALGARARAAVGTEALFASRAMSRRPYINGRGPSTSNVASGTMLISRVREFAALSVPDYRDVVGRITFRTTRRFLARFIARRNRSSLGALAFQYGHLDPLITDTYYVGRDPELVRLVDEESGLEIVRALDDLASSTSVYANLPDHVMRDTRELIRSTLERASSHGEVLKMLGGGVVLGPCDWGYCFYREARSKCDGNAAGPNSANRTPSVCASCLNFSATARHLDWWRRRLEDMESFSRLRGVPEQSKAIARQRLKEARTVVSAIERG